MTDFNDNGGVIRPENDSGMRAWCQVMYALHAFSAIGGLLTSASIIGSFLTGWPSIIAIIINFLTRGSVRGTWLESHWRWQLRTFWFAVAWSLAAIVLTLTLIGIPLALIIVAVLSIWILYRVVRGWLAVPAQRAMPVPD